MRFVNYVEMMCPVFRSDVLSSILPLFHMGYESGIDLVWCNAVVETDKDFAVIDATPIRHTEPVGGAKEANGFDHGKRYEDDIYAVLERHDLPWLSCLPYSARTRSGQLVRSRVRFALAWLGCLPALLHKRRTPKRLRAILVHFRDLLTRKPTNIPVRIAE